MMRRMSMRCVAANHYVRHYEEARCHIGHGVIGNTRAPSESLSGKEGGAPGARARGGVPRGGGQLPARPGRRSLRGMLLCVTALGYGLKNICGCTPGGIPRGLQFRQLGHPQPPGKGPRRGSRHCIFEAIKWSWNI
ncbi:hypothetical protein J6590_009449 [Homalodisca vitripennis]|nr:hypothetical protein J6590_009449 [Homalodisca vitripennis]